MQMQFDGIYILYGSETGTAQDLAENLWNLLHSREVPVICLPLDEYPIQDLCNEKIILFIVATSGNGEMPMNMRKSWQFFLSRKLQEKIWLSKVSFALLGLGDSSYQKFNYAAKKLYRRMLQLGARPIKGLALADEQHLLGIDQVYDEWTAELVNLEPILSFAGKKQKQSIEKNISNYCIEFHENRKGTNSFYRTTVLGNERQTQASHFQDTRLISFFIGEEEEDNGHQKYSPGDVLMVLPENLQNSIEMAQNCLKECVPFLDVPFQICRAHPYVPMSVQYINLFSSTPLTLRHSLRSYFDLQTCPRRNFLSRIAQISQNEMERERLLELTSANGIDEYLDYCVHSRRTIAEFLRDFPETSAAISPSDLFNLFPVIRPRAFSIASSPSAHPSRIQILVARVEYKVKKMKTPRLGLCSNFLCSLQPGQRVFVRIQPGTFHFDFDQPLVLIGPGTGVAPFRSIIAENELAMRNCPILLMFGCRGAKTDFYFEDEWKRCRRARVITAFSRDQEEKVYVQHKIIEHSGLVWEVLSKKGKILIAGSAGEMPRQVIAAIKEVAVSAGGIAPLGADKLIEAMEKNRSIQYETWS